ncbi:MAG TPA: hypothetical protein PKX75_22255 [Nitrospira sp.]|nr:hypothetical protein [Nitrospira sp.]
MQSFIMGRERREDYRQLRSRVESGAQGPLSEIQGTAIMSEESVHFLLIEWAEWQRRYEVYTGYPRRSCGMDAGGQVVTEESSDEQQEEAKWQRCAIVDRCIDDLPVPAQRAAIHRRYLSSVYQMRDYPASLAAAMALLLVAFRRKGILA